MIRSLLFCLFAVLFTTNVSAEKLTPTSLTNLLTKNFGSGNLPRPASGTTLSTLRSSHVAGFLSKSRDQIYIAMSSDNLCQFWVDAKTFIAFSADTTVAVVSLIRDHVDQKHCIGTLFAPTGIEPDVFLWAGPTAEGRSGLWISERGTAPILRLSEREPTVKVFKALKAQPFVSSIIAFGEERFAFKSNTGSVHVGLLGSSGESTTVVAVCAPPEDHPLFNPSPFKRHGRAADAAQQAVRGGRTYDPLAYFLCP